MSADLTERLTPADELRHAAAALRYAIEEWDEGATAEDITFDERLDQGWALREAAGALLAEMAPP